MAQSAGMGDSLLTDSQTKGVNKCCAKPPIVMKLAALVPDRVDDQIAVPQRDL
jgi:hypothetical protein